MMREKTDYSGVYKRGDHYSYRMRDQFGNAVEKAGLKHLLRHSKLRTMPSQRREKEHTQGVC